MDTSWFQHSVTLCKYLILKAPPSSFMVRLGAIMHQSLEKPMCKGFVPSKDSVSGGNATLRGRTKDDEN